MLKLGRSYLPAEAAVLFRRKPGNYVLVDRNGRPYVGQSIRGGERIDEHLREYPGEFVRAHFVADRSNTQYVRAKREVDAATKLTALGPAIRNARFPFVPAAWDRRKRRR